MRNRIWNNLSNIKFKALYTNALSRRSNFIGNVYSFFLSFASASSVAAWAIWKQYPLTWACIISISQIMHIAKPYFPFIKYDKEFLEMSFEFEQIYLNYEMLWFDFENNKDNPESIEARFYELRAKENDLEKMHKNAQSPKWKGLLETIQQETYTALSLNFE